MNTGNLISIWKKLQHILQKCNEYWKSDIYIAKVVTYLTDRKWVLKIWYLYGKNNVSYRNEMITEYSPVQ
jgi:hypothetical protein